MANVHFFGAGAYDYVLAHGGKIEKRDENEYTVDIPAKGLIALGGYSYHRGNCSLYAFEDGKVLDFTVETANRSLTLHQLVQGELQYFGSVENKEQLQALAK